MCRVLEKAVIELLEVPASLYLHDEIRKFHISFLSQVQMEIIVNYEEVGGFSSWDPQENISGDNVIDSVQVQLVLECVPVNSHPITLEDWEEWGDVSKEVYKKVRV
jgi:hypothetical protein